LKILSTLLILVAVTFLLTACEEPDRVVWSPDGNRVAVLTDSGLRLGDANGSLSTETPIKLKIFRWLPDSKHAVGVMEREDATWAELKQFLSEQQQIKVGHIAESFWSYTGNPNNWKLGNDPLAYYVLPYLEAKHGQRAYKDMLKKKLKVMNPTSLPGFSFYIVKLFDVQPESIRPETVLLRANKEIDDIRVSPKGRYFSVSEDSGNNSYKLSIVSLDGKHQMIVDSRAAECPDWSADGKNLFYISANKKPNAQESSDAIISLGSLLCQRITDADGKLLSHFGTPMTLCQLEFSERDKIRCLPDGSTVFSAQALQLPCIQNEFQKRDALFRLGPDFTSIKPVIFSRDRRDDLNKFEVNPGGTRAVIAGSHGEVMVLDLTNGDGKTLETDGPTERKFMPQWRSAEELCFPRRVTNKKPGDPDVEVVLASVTEDKEQILSKAWPVKSIGFLYDAQESSPKQTATHVQRRAR